MLGFIWALGGAYFPYLGFSVVPDRVALPYARPL